LVVGLLQREEEMKKILVTGAAGQIGSELTLALRQRYGAANVVAGGRKTRPGKKLLDSGPFETVDCLDAAAVANVVKKYRVDTIYHLAAILSAVAEAKPSLAWEVNINGLYNVLEVARAHGCSVFVPSSIGAFGGSTPLDDTPQDTSQRPSTMYGVTKVAGELLCDYYYTRLRDRYPRGSISRHHLKRNASRRWNHGLCGGDLLRSHQA
jgi:nucleoside-diphosphate-sugar epimerase